MTRAEYDETMTLVMNQARRMGQDDREVVLVMSRRVYREIRRFEQVEYPCLLSAEPNTYGTYNGMRIGIINESNDRYGESTQNMVAPALVGMGYNPGVNCAGDSIVVSEENENRLYQLASDNPLQFRDMGLTVRFEAARHPQDDTGNIAADTASASTGSLAFAEAIESLGTTAATTTTVTALRDMAEAYQAMVYSYQHTLSVSEITTTTGTSNCFAGEMGSGMRRKRRNQKKASSEQEMNPGDTKLMDDFLDSFKRHSVMQMGG